MVYIERELEKDIEKWLKDREILLIRGPRQCGKTTLLNNIKEKLIKNGAKPENVNYINFEDDMVRIKFEADCKEFIKSFILDKDEKVYCLMDEVQYVKNIGKKLKLIFDSFNVKMILTGSSSFDLTNLGKYLVGRVIFFDLWPFSFMEFLRAKEKKYEKIYEGVKIDLKKPSIKKTIFLDELNKLLKEYLTFGAYPRVVLEPNAEKKKEILKNIFMTYIEKDVVSLYGNQYRDKIVRLLKTLSSVESIVKYETLTINSGLKYNEVREIMPLLEDSFVIFLVKPFYKNLLNELRKNPKIYFIDSGIRNYLAENFNNPDFDFLYENFICNELKKFKVKYWRTTAKTEVDFVIEKEDEIIPIEVKAGAKIARSLRSFINAYKIKKAFIANLTKIQEQKINSCNLFIVPFVYF